MNRYYARICWNTKRWLTPSGDAARLESGTYAAEDRFGHEEWLFNFVWLLNGYHYAFLQGVNNSRESQQGRVIEVTLWAINESRKRVYVGTITNCEVLTEAESVEAYQLHKKAGWLKLMREDLEAVGGTVSKLSPDSLFNIRFRPSDATQFDDPLPIVSAEERVSKLKRYNLVSITDSDPEPRPARGRQGSFAAPALGSYSRRGTKGTLVDPYHPVLQDALMTLLQERFGHKNVLREANYVDLTVTYGKRRLLIEIKTDAVAKRAVREAIGQIMEYAFCGLGPCAPVPELFIVAPGLMTSEVSTYLSFLNKQFGLPVRYCSFVVGASLPPVFM